MSIVIPDGARPTLPTRSSKIATATWPVGEVSQGDRRLFSGSAANLQVRDSLDLFTGGLHQDDLGRGIIPKILVHLAQREVAAAKQHGEAVVPGPAIDRLRSCSDHSLWISENDELFSLERLQFVDDPLL